MAPASRESQTYLKKHTSTYADHADTNSKPAMAGPVMRNHQCIGEATAKAAPATRMNSVQTPWPTKNVSTSDANDPERLRRQTTTARARISMTGTNDQ